MNLQHHDPNDIIVHTEVALCVVWVLFFMKRFLPVDVAWTSRFEDKGVVGDDVLGALVLGALAITEVDGVTFVASSRSQPA